GCLGLRVARRGQRGHFVPIDEQSYIPVPPEVLWSKLRERLPSDEDEAKEWDNLCSALQERVHAELRPLRMSLRDAYQPFDPARRRWVGAWPLPDKEEHFAREFLRAASLAGFTPLSRFDLEKTRELKADLLSLPVTINWDHLDSRWIESLLKAEESLPEALSDFGGYVLALKRGLAVERRSGRWLMQKLECLQSQWLLRVGSLLQSLLQGFIHLSAKAWNHALPAARDWAETRHAAAFKQTARLLRAAGRQGAQLAPLAREAMRSLRMRISGTQVLRRLQPNSYRYAQWMFGDVFKKRLSTERAALIERLARAWEQEVTLRGRYHKPMASELGRSALESGNFLERVSVEHLPVSLGSLLAPAELQEPQFQEILIVYRLGGGDADAPRPPPRREICIRRFFEVAMKDIKLVLPQEAWRVRGRPLDMIRADLITMVGILGVLLHLFGDANKWLALVPAITLLSVRTFSNYRRVGVGSKSRVSSMLFDRCLDKDAALMRLLPDAAEAQVFAECVLTYWALIAASAERHDEPKPTIGKEELTWRGAEVVAELVEEVDLPRAGISPNFDGALKRLVRWGLIQAEKDGFCLTASRHLASATAKLRRARRGDILWEGL
ncbi:unnamed protein product, partial [Effrenium voratum]